MQLQINFEYFESILFHRFSLDNLSRNLLHLKTNEFLEKWSEPIKLNIFKNIQHVFEASLKHVCILYNLFLRIHFEILKTGCFQFGAFSSLIQPYFIFQASILYMVVVFGTKWFMRNRQPFQLTIPLNIWNFILAAFSIAGAVKMTPEFFGTIANKGIVGEYNQRECTKVLTFSDQPDFDSVRTISSQHYRVIKS